MAAPAHAKQVYQALLAHGYSSIQAIGIMANMYKESGIDPEASAMDSNGYRSYGLVQWNAASYPNAGKMVTGNATADINRQVAALASSAASGPRSKAASGSSASAVAGNWAAGFERCASCQPGGSQYASRTAFASTVAGWVSSGSWPQRGSSGAGGTGTATAPSGAATPGGTGTTTTATTTGDGCAGPGDPNCCALFVIPHTSVCVLSKSQARWVLGGLLIGTGTIIALVGVALILRSVASAAGAGAGTAGKAAGAAGEMIALFPPAEAAGVAMSAAGGKINRTAQRRAGARQQATSERRATVSEQREARLQSGG